MAEATPPEDWYYAEGRIDAAVVAAMKGAETWHEGCVAAARVAGLPEDEVLEVYDWSSGWNDTALFRFATVHIAGSSWGLFVRELAGTAFLLSDVDEPQTEYVWAWWSLPGDRDALDLAVRETWRDHWSDIPLPPAFSGADVLWEGPNEYLQVAHKNLDAVLVTDDRAWAAFKDRLDDVVEGIRHFAREGIEIDSLGGNAPRPAYDVTWLEMITAGPFLEGCRQDDVARRTLVSYFLMA